MEISDIQTEMETKRMEQFDGAIKKNFYLMRWQVDVQKFKETSVETLLQCQKTAVDVLIDILHSYIKDIVYVDFTGAEIVISRPNCVIQFRWYFIVVISVTVENDGKISIGAMLFEVVKKHIFVGERKNSWNIT